MIRRLLVVLVLLVGFAIGCSSGFGGVRTTHQLVVDITAGELGARDRAGRLPISLVTPHKVTINIKARKLDGSPDPEFTRYVRLSVQPGTISAIGGPPDRVVGRNVFLDGGSAENIEVSILGSYGDTRIWAEDQGYLPASPTRDPAPACSDNQDNDQNGIIDYPHDYGCAFANDDDERPGTYAAGASPPIFFATPRVADVRGVAQGGSATPFPKEQIQVDTGYDFSSGEFAHSVVVTRIASDGFYVTDLDDPRGYGSIFAFNFSSPPGMRVCDRLTSLAGTVTDFFGFTEIGFPTWSVERWDDRKRPCLVPEPHVFTSAEIQNTSELFKYESALVRVLGAPGVDVHVARNIGPGKPQPPDYFPTAEATDCDLNADGEINYDGSAEPTDPDFNPELRCARACQNDPECAEYSTFAARSNFRIVVAADGVTASIQANATAATFFEPLEQRGKPLKAFTGTLRYFSGGSQFTIEARCADDIVVDPAGAPLPPDKACVRARTAEDFEVPQ